MVIIAALCSCGSFSDSPPTVVPDTQLEAEIVRLLASDERVAVPVEIRVSEGIVDVSGAVPSADEVRYILRRVGSVAGVRGLVNRLRVVR